MLSFDFNFTSELRIFHSYDSNQKNIEKASQNWLEFHNHLLTAAGSHY